MGRLWIVLIVVWYGALTTVKTEVNLVENKSRDSTSTPETTDENGRDLSDGVDYSKYIFANWFPGTYIKHYFDRGCVDGYSNSDDCLEYLIDNRVECKGCNKRSQDDFEGPRRIPFRAWGGKRAKPDSSIPKRVPFNSWGGKRSEVVNLDDPEDGIENEKRLNKQQSKKTKFHSWGGKRSIPGMDSNMDEADRNNIVIPGIRRLKFSSWGGKRSDFDDEAKRTFNSWGGKRGQTFNAWGGKRNWNLDDFTEEYKKTFNAWGG